MLHIDIETYSETDLIKCGSYRYAADPTFEILLLAYAYDDEEPQIVDLASGERIPEDVLDHLEYDHEDPCSAFNANFERVCLSTMLLGWGSFFSPERWRCSAVHARYAGLPGSLEGAANALKLQQRKDPTGAALIRYFCKPCKPTKINGGRTRNRPEDDPEKWEQFKAYCLQDVRTEQAIHQALDIYPVPEKEWRLFHLDQRINDRGVWVHLRLVDNALQLNEIATKETKEQLKELTGCQNPNSLPQFKTWLRKTTGYAPASLSKKAMPEVLARYAEMGETKAIEAIQLRDGISKSSVKKYDAAARAHVKGVVRGSLQFYGASTGRWAGRIIQTQNLPRNEMDHLDIARKLVLQGETEMLEVLFGPIPDTLSELIRTMLIPRTFSRFAVADFSAIEARVIAWLAGEQWRLDVFNTHGKIYEASASRMFGVPIEKIDKGSPLRAKGKVAELALGYQGAIGALRQMGGESMGLSDEEMQRIVGDWRRANEHIVKLWSVVENVAQRVIAEKRILPLKLPHTALTFGMQGSCMTIKLPSGRKLYYQNARREKGSHGMSIVYNGYRQNSWGKVETYGGKLVENIVQAIARDCLAEAMIAVDRELPKTKIVFHVHDEIVAEVPLDEPKKDLKAMLDIMDRELPWAKGLKLGGAGFITNYYLKD